MHGICTYRQYIFIGIGPYALEIEKFCFIINVHCRLQGRQRGERGGDYKGQKGCLHKFDDFVIV